MGRGYDTEKLKNPPRRNPFRQEILDREDVAEKSEDRANSSSGYFKYLGKNLKEEDISLAERVFSENDLSIEERNMVAKSLSLEEIRLINRFFRIQFDGERDFYITHNSKVIGGRGDNEHYTTPSHCRLHQQSPTYIEKIWLSDGERSRIPSRGPSKVVRALDEAGEPREEGTYFGHSWSFRYRPLGWHGGRYLDTEGLAINPFEKHEKPGENTPWPWLEGKITTILASRANNSAEAGVLYYLDRLEVERAIDRPFKSEGKRRDESRKEERIAQEIESVLEGGEFGEQLTRRNPIEITDQEVSAALASLLERGLIESIKVGPPWARKHIYKITPEAYLGRFKEGKTQEEKWQKDGALLGP